MILWKNIPQEIICEKYILLLIFLNINKLKYLNLYLKTQS